MALHTHQAAHTEGKLIRWPRAYDLLLKIVSLGREGQFRRRMINTAGLKPGQRVLDVGCGTGTLALAAADAVGKQGRVWGIDPAPEMIARARAKAAKAGAKVTFEVGVAEALDFPDRSVDVVMNSLMFHHLPAHLHHEGLSEMRRVIAPGGRMVMIDFGGAEHAEGLAEQARAAGFQAVTTARFGPRIMFSLIAEAGGVGVA